MRLLAWVTMLSSDETEELPLWCRWSPYQQMMTPLIRHRILLTMGILLRGAMARYMHDRWRYTWPLSCEKEFQRRSVTELEFLQLIKLGWRSKAVFHALKECSRSANLRCSHYCVETACLRYMFESTYLWLYDIVYHYYCLWNALRN
jgi:hypothetical protein